MDDDYNWRPCDKALDAMKAALAGMYVPCVDCQGSRVVLAEDDGEGGFNCSVGPCQRCQKKEPGEKFNSEYVSGESPDDYGSEEYDIPSDASVFKIDQRSEGDSDGSRIVGCEVDDDSTAPKNSPPRKKYRATSQEIKNVHRSHSKTTPPKVSPPQHKLPPAGNSDWKLSPHDAKSPQKTKKKKNENDSTGGSGRKPPPPPPPAAGAVAVTAMVVPVGVPTLVTTRPFASSITTVEALPPEPPSPPGMPDAESLYCEFCNNSPCVWLQMESDVLTFDGRRNINVGGERAVGRNEPNETRRWRSYTHASFLLRGYMGRHNRKRLPPCCVRGIRALFPDPAGKHTGFKEHSSRKK